jgi:hypothetical protein
MVKPSLASSIVLALIAAVASALTGCASPGVTAAVHRDPVQLQRILDQPNHGNESLQNLLSNSIAFDCAECVNRLLKAGLKPDAVALSAAALTGHEDIARLLIDAGGDSTSAMSVIHSQTRKWVGGCCISPDQAQSASALFRKIDQQRGSSPIPPVSNELIPKIAAPEAPSSREAPSFQESAHPDDYAVVVGIERYDGLPPAPYAARDAAAAAEFIKALGVPPRNVITLTDAHATRSSIAKYLEGWLADNADEQSTVYFYYSGYGASDARDRRAYLLPFDGDPQYLEQTGIFPQPRL